MRGCACADMSTATRNGMLSVARPPIIKVDPQGRCAVALIYGMKFVVIPLVTEQSTSAAPTLTDSRFRSYIIDPAELTRPLRNVVDFELMHGTLVPTLAVLYEPTPTWVGRFTVTKDTKAIAALSLNTKDKINPIVWDMDLRLPSDVMHVVAVPSPLGGVLCLGANCVIYLHQAKPPNGVALNLLSKESKFQYKQTTEFPIALDASKFTMLDKSRFLFSMKTGQLCLMTLVSDGRSLKNFEFEPLPSSVLCSCMTRLGPAHLFLGSKFGDSTLLSYWEVAAQEQTGQESPVKKRRVDDGATGEAAASKDMEFDELQIYDDDDEAQERDKSGTTFKFSVCDKLMNIGPIQSSAFGFVANPSPHGETIFGRIKTNKVKELVTCSGYDKNGALCVISQHVRPEDILSTTELPGCRELWAIRYSDGASGDDGAHRFLVLAKDDATVILHSGEELTMCSDSGFFVTGPTLAVANMGGSRLILQVAGQEMRLLNGLDLVQRIAFPDGVTAAECSATESVAVLRMSDGSVMVVTVDAVASKMETQTFFQSASDIVIACSLYEDKSGVFETADKVGRVKPDAAQEHAAAAAAESKKRAMEDLADLDDDDAILYGMDDDDVELAEKPEPVASEAVPAAPAEAETPNAGQRTFWCAICRHSGSLEVYRISLQPELKFEQSFHFKGFALTPVLLCDEIPRDNAQESAESEVKAEKKGESAAKGNPAPAKRRNDMEAPVIKEVLLVGLAHGSRPYLSCVLSTGSVVMYEAFAYISDDVDAQAKSRLALRFKKVEQALILQEVFVVYQHAMQAAKKKKKQRERRGTKTTTTDLVHKYLQYYDNVGEGGEFDGIFVCGRFPSWIMMGRKKALRIHPMWQYGKIDAFTPFHTASCINGFATLAGDGTLRVSTLMPGFNYDAPLVTKKIHMRRSCVSVEYHVENEIYALVTKDRTVAKYDPQFTNEEPPENPEPVKRDPRFIPPKDSSFALHLLAPGAWEVVPGSKIEMDPFDQITTCKVIDLRSQEHSSGKRGLVVLGIARVCGEEVSSRGRVMILDILDVVPEPGQPLTKNKFKVLYNEIQKGAVTAICGVSGYLLTCCNQSDGAKIIVWNFVNKEKLSGIAFVESKVLISSIQVMRNLIVAADVFQGVSVFKFKAETNMRQGTQHVGGILSRVSETRSRDIRVTAVNFFVHEELLSFAFTDELGNVFVECFVPDDEESQYGRLLSRRADFHLGMRANCFLRVTCPQLISSNSSTLQRRHALVYGSSQGSLGIVCPVKEMVYRRLYMLQMKLTNTLEHRGGLNPKAYRMATCIGRRTSNPQRNMLDGALLSSFLTLGLMQQRELARRIGTSVQQITEDMLDIQHAVSVL